MTHLAPLFLIAFSLFGESKLDKSLRAEIAAQAVTISDLQAQVAAAHVQTATANGAASATRATLNAHSAKNSVVLRTGSSAAMAGAELAAEAVRIGKENKASLLLSNQAQVQQTARNGVLLFRYGVVIMVLAAVTLTQFAIFLFRKNRQQ